MTDSEIREDERRLCIADICHWCAEGNPVDERYRHRSKGNKLYCPAAHIWMRVQGTGHYNSLSRMAGCPLGESTNE